ncbi:hypothetical protein V5N11_034871 [Cardamine amara subsp. amara]|uniref:Uncharacterized protein n=1 Tax=Cardamine amara subsp. amara TaxID=228776 RepID=A0ABD1AXJ4_CARAN
MDSQTNQTVDTETNQTVASQTNQTVDTQTNQTVASQTKPEATSSCRKRVKDDNATYFANLKDRMDEFIHASMDDHKACFKTTMNKIFGTSNVVAAEKQAETKPVEIHSPLDQTK